MTRILEQRLEYQIFHLLSYGGVRRDKSRAKALIISFTRYGKEISFSIQEKGTQGWQNIFRLSKPSNTSLRTWLWFLRGSYLSVEDCCTLLCEWNDEREQVEQPWYGIQTQNHARGIERWYICFSFNPCTLWLQSQTWSTLDIIWVHETRLRGSCKKDIFIS